MAPGLGQDVVPDGELVQRADGSGRTLHERGLGRSRRGKALSRRRRQAARVELRGGAGRAGRQGGGEGGRRPPGLLPAGGVRTGPAAGRREVSSFACEGLGRLAEFRRPLAQEPAGRRTGQGAPVHEPLHRQLAEEPGESLSGPSRRARLSGRADVEAEGDPDGRRGPLDSALARDGTFRRRGGARDDHAGGRRRTRRPSRADRHDKLQREFARQMAACAARDGGGAAPQGRDDVLLAVRRLDLRGRAEREVREGQGQDRPCVSGAVVRRGARHGGCVEAVDSQFPGAVRGDRERRHRPHRPVVEHPHPGRPPAAAGHLEGDP